jgi:hypothetical protein
MLDVLIAHGFQPGVVYKEIPADRLHPYSGDKLSQPGAVQLDPSGVPPTYDLSKWTWEPACPACGGAMVPRDGILVCDQGRVVTFSGEETDPYHPETHKIISAPGCGFRRVQDMAVIGGDPRSSPDDIDAVRRYIRRVLVLRDGGPGRTGSIT